MKPTAHWGQVSSLGSSMLLLAVIHNSWSLAEGRPSKAAVMFPAGLKMGNWGTESKAGDQCPLCVQRV